MRRLLLLFTFVAACAGPGTDRRPAATSSLPTHATPVATSPTGGPSYVHDLAITSRTPLINREAWLIAGFWETARDVRFSVIGFDNAVHDSEFAHKDDPAALAALQQRVSRYLARGGWEPMLSAEKKVASDGSSYWQMGSLTAAANTVGELLFQDGKSFVGGSHFSRFPRMELCEHPFDVDVTGVAVDLKTRWIWATYQPTSGMPSCPGIHLAITFQAWNSNWYPMLLRPGT